jgi:hypothetical protein
MKLRIEIEKKNYEVTVEFLEDAHNGHRNWHPGEVEVPESVTRPRPPLKLLERFPPCWRYRGNRSARTSRFW